MSNRERTNEERRESEPRRWRRVNTWVAVGAVVLIVILIIWLSIALASGDTDVAASVIRNITPSPSFFSMVF